MIPVSDLYAACEMMLREKWGYIWGTSGQLWTEAKQKAATRDMTVKYGSRWIGHMVADCSGVMVYIWKQHGMSIYHGSNTIRRRHCGELVKEPKPGYAAFKVNGDDYHHIGIVAADGLNVYEAKGTQAGFVMSAASSWHCFAPFIDVDYTGEDEKQGGGAVIYSASVTTSGGRLNIRCGPGTNYRAVGTFRNGEKVDVHAEYDVDGDGAPDWAFIAGDGITGYVSMDFLTPIDRPGSAQDAPREPEGESTAGTDPAQPAPRWAVWIACDNEEEARRYAGDVKDAVVIRYEKPPG